MLYTVKLGYSPPDNWGQPRGVTVSASREFIVEASSEAAAFDQASRELTTELLVQAANVKPYAISYERGGDRRQS